MVFKKIISYHLIPVVIAVIITLSFIASYKTKLLKDYSIGRFYTQSIKSIFHIDFFNQPDLDITNQVAFSIALKKRIPIILGSSELTSHHLEAIGSRFFNKNPRKDRFLSVGHAGFQSFALLTVLAANKQLLRQSKLTIILSPGWFEKQYASGTSLKSFFEFCPPNYLYQIKQDTGIDIETKKYIKNYLYNHYDNITSPDATIRQLSKKDNFMLNKLFNAPFSAFDKFEINVQTKTDVYLTSQKIILNALQRSEAKPYLFYNRQINWDSLQDRSKQEFKSICKNNSMGVEDSYYNTWLKDKPKKQLSVVSEKNNTEYQDLLALIRFLKSADCEPLFVIMPLNTRAHQNLEVLLPTIEKINHELTKNHFKVLNMFTPNVQNYEMSVLEDIMHPYNTGWYQIDKFIFTNYHD